jgi:3-phosphoshikimate 1-carboxyvinyltransferase
MASSTLATVVPARRINGRFTVPGDKSISHRYALLASVAEGTSTLSNYAPGADCASTLRCLRALGIDIVEDEGSRTVTIAGRGLGGWRAPHSALDAGNSGTTMRMMAGMLAAQSFTTTMVGDESLSRRPMRRVIDPLTRMGARIQAIDGHAPLTIVGTPLRAMTFRPDIPSAQVKSAVLLAGLYADGTTTVTEVTQTRDHTERALQAFGFDVRVNGLTVSVSGKGRPHGQRLSVPGDVSSAAFWMVAAAALPGSRVEIEDVGLNPTRTGLFDVLRRFGARVDVRQHASPAGEPSGTVIVEAGAHHDIEIPPQEVPGLIDELPAIAALAAHSGRVTIRGASELRVKESDRISTLVTGFRDLGIDAEERADGLIVRGTGAPSGGTADAKGDHRMAMAFAIAALAAAGPSRIEGADSVAISYPGFFETLERLMA